MNWLKILACFFILSANAQTPVFSLQKDTLFVIDNNTVSNTDGKVLYTTQGNIVFEDASTSYKKILFTLAVDSFQQEKNGKIYNKKGATSKFSIQESTILYQQGETYYPLATVVKNEDNWALYNNANDSLLAFIPNVDFSNAVIFATFMAIAEKENLVDKLQDILNQQKQQTSDGLAYIEPVFGNGIVWVWDGLYLYPYGTNKSHPMTWKFQNNKLGPINYPRNQEEWSWDGSGLKPYWGGNPQSQFTWQNGVLRQIWNNNHNNEYIIENNVIRKRFGSYGDNEWQMTGDVPLPIITAVVLGLLFR